MRTISLFISLVIIVMAESHYGERNCSDGNTSGYYIGRRPGRRLEERNKVLVLTFYQRLFGDKDFSAIDEFLGDPYIQHNPLVADGKEGLRTVAMEWLRDEPQRILDIRRVGADGDLVWVHQRSLLFGKETAVMDAFRVANGKIVEHWDVIQDVPATSQNNNTMF